MPHWPLFQSFPSTYYEFNLKTIQQTGSQSRKLCHSTQTVEKAIAWPTRGYPHTFIVQTQWGMWPISDTWNHAPEPLKAKVPMSPYSLIIISIFHCKVVNRTVKPEHNQQGKKEAEGMRQRRGGMRQKKGEACEWGCCLAEGKAKHGEQEGEVTHFVLSVYIFSEQEMLQRHPSAFSPPNYSNYHGTLWKPD